MQLQEFLVQLGGALLSIGMAATDIQNTLKRVATALGAPKAAIFVFPTFMAVGMPGEQQTRFEVSVPSGEELRFDRASSVYAVADRAVSGTITATEGIKVLHAVEVAKPRFRGLVRVFGHGFAAAGVALVLLGAELPTMLDALVLGMLVGAAKLAVRPGTHAAILFPVATAFLLALLIFSLGKTVVVGAPLQALIPPLVTLLPGAVLTTGARELAAGDTIAGASRLVSGIVQLGFLATGILAAMTITGVPARAALVATTPTLGAFQPWLGVILFSLGIFLYYCGPRRSLFFLTFVLLGAYGAQVLGAMAVGTVFSGFFGACALTLLAYLIQSAPGAPPAVVCFLPSFWLLVPGATGLIELAQSAAGVGFDPRSVPNVLGSIVAIALGVLVGTALFRQIYTFTPAPWRLRPV
ncbi:threonine/serine exporter family protein [Leifsonia xyli]|uniref:threonine/serine exporter family protein n=1 Tax=Leifsonia xyli TaxID=1575 RepID=UPI00146FC340|nr:threonine/serine exporter family protein [Leifsonia xyli]